MNIKDEIIKKRKLPSHFFSPNESDVNDISKLKNIDRAKDLLLYYINNNKKITIFADIDIDGVMATSIVYNWLEGIYHDNKRIIYQQRQKGHGVKADIIKQTDLLIIVDSSSNEIEEIEEILKRKLAKDVLIIDHHETINSVEYSEFKGGQGNKVLATFKLEQAKMDLIENVILLNPHNPQCNFENKDISGAMLTYRFLEYVAKDDELWADKINRLSDLCAISIISDVMKVTNMENRYYYYRGMSSIQNNGLFNFMNKNRINTFNVNSNKLAFEINPKLNATIRMHSIKSLFELFLTTNKLASDRSKVVKIINGFYEKKRELEEEIRNKMTILFEHENVIIYQNNYKDNYGFSNNFNGVIASQITNDKQKHVIIVNSELKGSARAFGDFNFKDYIDNSGCASGAGHQGAFGIKINSLEKLKEYFQTTPPPVNLILSTDYEIELDFKKISKTLFEEIEELQFMVGNGFDNIKFKINNIVIKDVKETSGGNLYYIDDRKDYIRIMNQTNLEFDELDNINVYGSLFIKEYFGKSYFEIHCVNIEQN